MDIWPCVVDKQGLGREGRDCRYQPGPDRKGISCVAADLCAESPQPSLGEYIRAQWLGWEVLGSVFRTEVAALLQAWCPGPDGLS